MIVPGSLISFKALNALFKTAVCCFTLNGSPRGWPIGHFKNTALGGFTSSVNSLTADMLIVEIPALSISLCIRPTDRLQRPQPGVKIAASTLFAFSLSAIFGPVAFIRAGI